MSLWVLRALERVHGHIGFVTVIALLHPVVLLWRRPTRRAILAASLATALATVTAILGIAVYPAYRSELKQQIFIHAPTVGWAFETKEHLAAGVMGFAWVGLAAHLASARSTSTSSRERLGRTARAAYAAATLLSLATAGLGVWVASYRSF